MEPFADPPDVSLLWCERSIVVDNTTGAVVIQSTRNDDEDFPLLEGHGDSEACAWPGWGRQVRPSS
jgi:hypothetical protein